jgi:hypothetical protein
VPSDPTPFGTLAVTRDRTSASPRLLLLTCPGERTTRFAIVSPGRNAIVGDADDAVYWEIRSSGSDVHEVTVGEVPAGFLETASRPLPASANLVAMASSSADIHPTASFRLTELTGGKARVAERQMGLREFLGRHRREFEKGCEPGR